MGDLIRFTNEHSSQPGYDYCADWVGIVYDKISHAAKDMHAFPVYWVTQHGSTCGVIHSDMCWKYEVINESG